MFSRTKKPADKSLRQRLRADSDEARRLSTGFNYYAQRSETSANTGRKFRQEVLKPAATTVGNFWVQRFGLGILLIAIGLCIGNALRVTSQVKIQQIGPHASSSLFHNQSAYQSSAAALIRSSVFNSNKLTINTGKISQQLLATYPELSSATVTLPLISHRPIVYVSYSQPALILHNASGSYVLDTDGKVLIPTNAEAVALGLPSVTDKSGFVLQQNKQVLTTTDIAFIQAVVAGLKAKNVAVGEMTLPPAANELDVAIAGKPYFVKFNLHASGAKLQIGSFLAVQAHLTGEGVTPAKYIDVRVDGRAYYQ